MDNILGYYSNGAIRIWKGNRYYEFIAFQDCKECNGRGYFEGAIYSGAKYIQCEACALKHGDIYALEDRAKELQSEVKKILKQEGMKIPAQGRLSQKAFAFCQDFNINHPLAKEYRSLLRKAWQEKPTYKECENE